MRSVKGMTIGSPEFVAVVKAAEREGEVTEFIGGISARVDRLLSDNSGFTTKQKRDLRRILRDIGEVLSE